jgi:hypothetical protein
VVFRLRGGNSTTLTFREYFQNVTLALRVRFLPGGSLGGLSRAGLLPIECLFHLSGNYKEFVEFLVYFLPRHTGAGGNF